MGPGFRQDDIVETRDLTSITLSAVTRRKGLAPWTSRLEPIRRKPFDLRGFGYRVTPDARVRGWNLHERKTMRRKDKLSHARKIDTAVASAK